MEAIGRKTRRFGDFFLVDTRGAGGSGICDGRVGCGCGCTISVATFVGRIGRIGRVGRDCSLLVTAVGSNGGNGVLAN